MNLCERDEVRGRLGERENKIVSGIPSEGGRVNNCERNCEREREIISERDNE